MALTKKKAAKSAVPAAPKPAAKPAAAKPPRTPAPGAEMPTAPTPQVVGKVVLRALEDVKPNTWNPNEMTKFEREALRVGLLSDGWLASQSLLIWGTDEKGRRRDVIIDGEQRWTVARDCAFKQGPMVFLDGITESAAKALTVKMDSKRGTLNPDRLGALIREIQFELRPEGMAHDLGIPDAELMRLLAETPFVLDGSGQPAPAGGATPEMPSGRMSHVRMVQLFFDHDQHEEFARHTKDLAARYKTTNITETIIEVVRRAVAPS